MAKSSAEFTKGGAVVELADNDVGYLQDGITVTKEEEIFTAGSQIDGIISPLKRWRTSLEYKFAFTMLQPTLASWQASWDPSDTIAGGILVFGQMAETAVTERVWDFIATVPGGATLRTMVVHEGTSETPGPMAINDADLTSVPTVISCIMDPAGDTAAGHMFTVTDL